MSDFSPIEYNWNDYYDLVKGRPPRDTLVKALSFFPNDISKKTAIDLGCGVGNDTLELISNGWNVLAIDAEQGAIDKIKKRFHSHIDQLEFTVSTFEELTLPSESMLINASFALPFCKPESFTQLWNRIVHSLNVGGRFAGHLFGVNDDWADRESMTFFTRQETESLFKKFEIEFFEEKDEDGKVASGDAKHWHLFSIVARKMMD